MTNQVDEKIKKERVTRLLKVSDELEKAYLDQFINHCVEVLVEKVTDEKSVGHTGNYLKVEINGKALKNTLVMVKIVKRVDNYLIGEII